ncbi:ABC transporter substrate-binding protein, partial [Paracidovorax cattleyae]|uniref:ABC transporter substrate-binding protein n=1 Tax=Paracidovorax cattleyae TaxID=80868 RepID=UPI0018AF7ED4
LPALAQPAPDLRRVTLRVGDQTGASRGLLQAAGLLDDVPYRIDWSTYAAAVNLHEALKANAADIGSANDSPTVSAIAGGSRILAVASWTNGGKGTSLLVRKDSPIQSVAELRGKTVSPTTRGSVAHFTTVGILKQAGIAPDEVKLAFLNPTDASAAFGSGSIDAWAIWGIFRARTIGALGARVLHDGVGINSGQSVLSATRSAVADPAKRAAIAHFAQLTDQGYAWARANPDAYIDWYSAFSKQDRAVVASLYEENAAYRRVPLDSTFVARLQRTHAVWVEAGVLKGGIDFDQYVYRDLPMAAVS